MSQPPQHHQGRTFQLVGCIVCPSLLSHPLPCGNSLPHRRSLLVQAATHFDDRFRVFRGFAIKFWHHYAWQGRGGWHAKVGGAGRPRWAPGCHRPIAFVCIRMCVVVVSRTHFWLAFCIISAYAGGCWVCIHQHDVICSRMHAVSHESAIEMIAGDKHA